MGLRTHPRHEARCGTGDPSRGRPATAGAQRGSPALTSGMTRARSAPPETAGRPDALAEVVALLFTDIEGSSRLEQAVGTAEYARLRARHRQIVRAAVSEHGGVERGTEGDSF